MVAVISCGVHLPFVKQMLHSWETRKQDCKDLVAAALEADP